MCETPFPSVPAGHKALFNEVRRLYHLAGRKYQGHVALVQAALLLSHWSPYDNSTEVNNFWADEAFHHATIGRLHDSQQSYHRVIWWCCIVRNRVLSLALRRPHKLRRYESGPMITLADFNHRRFPNGTRLKQRRFRAAEIFISLCKLSMVMNKIVLMRHPGIRWDDWRADQRLDSAHIDLDNIASTDQMMTSWSHGFECTVARMDDPKLDRHLRVSIHTLRIVAL